MTYPSALLASLVAAPLSYGAYKLILFFYDQWTSPLRVLPGPPSTSLIFGNMKEITNAVCISRLFVSLLSLIYDFIAGEFCLARKMGQRIWVNHHIRRPLRSKVYSKTFMVYSGLC